ncbi:MAG: hypothetical protein MZW92_69250 [Comamonadaceae bacterium]|nr:hypothetical protein [Comamonadaceae bacterium]
MPARADRHQAGNYEIIVFGIVLVVVLQCARDGLWPVLGALAAGARRAAPYRPGAPRAGRARQAAGGGRDAARGARRARKQLRRPGGRQRRELLGAGRRDRRR